MLRCAKLPMGRACIEHYRLLKRQCVFTISSAIWIQCTNVTDRRTDTERQQRLRLCIASHGNKTMYVREWHKYLRMYMYRHAKVVELELICHFTKRLKAILALCLLKSIYFCRFLTLLCSKDNIDNCTTGPQHPPSFLKGGCSSCHPTVSEHWRENNNSAIWNMPHVITSSALS